MIYYCNACRFVFQRSSQVSRCPDCGKQFIRYATPAEREEFCRYQREFYPERFGEVRPAI